MTRLACLLLFSSSSYPNSIIKMFNSAGSFCNNCTGWDTTRKPHPTAWGGGHFTEKGDYNLALLKMTKTRHINSITTTAQIRTLSLGLWHILQQNASRQFGKTSHNSLALSSNTEWVSIGITLVEMQDCYDASLTVERKYETSLASNQGTSLVYKTLEVNICQHMSTRQSGYYQRCKGPLALCMLHTVISLW